MTQPTTQPITIPALKQRIRRCSFTFAVCAVVLVIVATIGVQAAQQPDTLVKRHNITIPAMLRHDASTLKQQRTWQWDILRVNNQPMQLVLLPKTVLVHWAPGTQLDYGALATLRPHAMNIGLVVPWLHLRSHTIKLEVFANTQPQPTSSELNLARSMVANIFTRQEPVSSLAETGDLLTVDYDPAWLDRLNTGDGHTWSIRPHMLLFDLAMLLAVLLCLMRLLQAMKLDFKLQRLIRKLQRLIRKECPKCRYNLSGIMHQATNCPECGQTLALKP